MALLPHFFSKFAKCTPSALNSILKFFCVVYFVTLFKQEIKYKKILNKNEIPYLTTNTLLVGVKTN
jgi:hypothetical protein